MSYHFLLESFIKNMMDVCIPALRERNWSFVFKYMRKRSIAINRPKLAEYICIFLLDGLISYGCKDIEVVERVLEIYHRCWLHNFFRQNSEEDEYVRRKFLAYKHAILGPLYSFLKTDISHHDIMINAVENGDVRLATVSLKYGYGINIPPRDITLRNSYGVSDVLGISRTLLKFWKKNPCPLYEESAKHANSLVLQLRDDRGRMLGHTQRGFQRICFMAMAMNAVMLKMDGSPAADNYVECIRLFFISHSKPFVSRDELEEFLVFLCRLEPTEVVFEMVEVFSNLFYPEGLMPYHPRSLQDMCRTVVRSALCRHKPCLLPRSIGELPLPPSVKCFILGMTYAF